MHRLTCNDADRLAADLDRAATGLHELAAWHHRYAAALEIVGDQRIALHHETSGKRARWTAHDLQDYATRLRQRAPLWDQPTPAQRERLNGSTRTRQLTARGA